MCYIWLGFIVCLSTFVGATAIATIIFWLCQTIAFSPSPLQYFSIYAKLPTIEGEGGRMRRMCGGWGLFVEWIFFLRVSPLLTVVPCRVYISFCAAPSVQQLVCQNKGKRRLLMCVCSGQWLGLGLRNWVFGRWGRHSFCFICFFLWEILCDVKDLCFDFLTISIRGQLLRNSKVERGGQFGIKIGIYSLFFVITERTRRDFLMETKSLCTLQQRL